MKRSFILLVATVVTGGNILFAQSVDQGRKFFYYERWKSAQETFEKVLAANPNNIDAVYWLGQTLLELKDSVGAKNLYQKSLTQNGNAPLLLAGMGQIELMEGKANDARQHFETALTLTKGKDIEVFNAVGRANVEARSGDANYAIEKLNLATAVKNFKDPETYLLTGDAHRKLIDGGNAVQSYTKALGLDPKLAAAKYKIGKVYLTQGNKDFFLPAFEEAVALDPAYTPAYYELFYYWYSRDVNKAAPYLDKYIANADQGPDMEYLKTDFLYSSGKTAEAKTKAESLIAQYGDKVNPRMYRLVAFAADTLGDAPTAKKSMETFLVKANEEFPVQATDYEELAKINSKIPGNEAEVFANLMKAVDKDTVVENKTKYLNKAAAIAKAKGDRNQEAILLGIAYRMDPNPSQRDLYNYGFAHYQAKNYDSTMAVFGIYKQKYPNEIFGYLWSARAAKDKDTTMEIGIAAAEYGQLLENAKRIDSVKYKAQVMESLFFLAGYQNNVKKDKDSAIYYLSKVLEIEPANPTATEYMKLLSKPRPAQPATKPKTGGNAAGSGNKANGK
ncbi:tetratricopeptide repeat protein [Paraflavitalea sp. CAU 1676]|uniref:tetratricopeptide repeat protein n=1 Tax=Paraflavitalea sp. CAU 1676 TaxID=3032598 RepID=UPI0023DB5E64|nr:tetratricopeptide repeat protein [Paraflavitalea sp. CAU 1676]MDF2192989.1 tetratricopeptide repeat protein [Paraflavitalea sp. CAU 1676]